MPELNNWGTLFKNARKTEPKHPDYTGDLVVNGKNYRQAAWLKKDKNGKTYMSVAITPKDGQHG